MISLPPPPPSTSRKSSPFSINEVINSSFFSPSVSTERESRRGEERKTREAKKAGQASRGRGRGRGRGREWKAPCSVQVPSEEAVTLGAITDQYKKTYWWKYQIYFQFLSPSADTFMSKRVLLTVKLPPSRTSQKYWNLSHPPTSYFKTASTSSKVYLRLSSSAKKIHPWII